MIHFLYLLSTSQACSESILLNAKHIFHSSEQIDCAMLTSANVFHDCRVPSEVSRTGSVSAELGRGLCHLHHARDWSPVATFAGSLWPTIQNSGTVSLFHCVNLSVFWSNICWLNQTLARRIPVGSGWRNPCTWWSVSTCCCQDTWTIPAEYRPMTGKRCHFVVCSAAGL